MCSDITHAKNSKTGELIFCACVRVWLDIKLIIIKEDNEFRGIRGTFTIYGEVGSYGISSCVPPLPSNSH